MQWRRSDHNRRRESIEVVPATGVNSCVKDQMCDNVNQKRFLA